MNLFYYIFYRITSFYRDKNIDKVFPEIYGSALTSILQFSIFMLFISILDIFKLEKNGVVILLSTSVMIPITYNAIFVFTKKKYEEQEIKWNSENKTKKRVKGYLIVIWLILFYPILFFCIHQIGGKYW